MSSPVNGSARTIVVLGGYGNFGERIVAALAREPDAKVLIAGRDAAKATQVAGRIGGNTRPWEVDCRAANFSDRLRALNAFAVVHTAGPFQGQDYDVARACIAAGCHYVDLADGRDFVANIERLDAQARANDVLVVAGASSLPALSSAVVDRYAPAFARIDAIEHAISAGAKPPGIATMQGVLGYVGKPFKRWQDGSWVTAYGWQDAVRHRFPKPVGARWLAGCDVADLELFPKRYAPVQSVVFRAGVGFAATTLTVWALSWLVRAGAIGNVAASAQALHRAAKSIEPLGTKWSAMYVRVSGIDAEQRPCGKTWTLLAGDDHGPNIPCFPAIALARKLLRRQIAARGAQPCMGLLSVDEILNAVPNLNLRTLETHSS